MRTSTDRAERAADTYPFLGLLLLDVLQQVRRSVLSRHRSLGTETCIGTSKSLRRGASAISINSGVGPGLWRLCDRRGRRLQPPQAHVSFNLRASTPRSETKAPQDWTPLGPFLAKSVRALKPVPNISTPTARAFPWGFPCGQSRQRCGCARGCLTLLRRYRPALLLCLAPSRACPPATSAARLRISQ
jgi:hypothetical protein